MMSMSKVESAISWAEAIARDDTHGYSQYSRWWPDFDCSSLVISAFQQAGIPVHDNGATFTGNMYTVFCRTGFKDVTSKCNIATGAGLKRGDVLLRDGHTAMYCGNGLEVEAAGDEYGGIGGQTGDQTGYEILIQYYVPNWQFVLRYEEDGENTFMFEVELIQKGSTGDSVKLWQRLLRGWGYKDDSGATIKVDGVFGSCTEQATVKFQTKHGLEPDAIVGQLTWAEALYQ